MSKILNEILEKMNIGAQFLHNEIRIMNIAFIYTSNNNLTINYHKYFSLMVRCQLITNLVPIYKEGKMKKKSNVTILD